MNSFKQYSEYANLIDTRDLTLPLSGESDVANRPLEFSRDNLTTDYVENVYNQTIRLDQTRCDHYADPTRGEEHVVYRMVARDDDLRARGIPAMYADTVLDLNTANHEVTLLLTKFPKINFEISNSASRVARYTRDADFAGFFELYDGVYFRLFYNPARGGWNIATNFVVNGENFRVDGLELGRMFLDIVNRTPRLSTLDPNSVYYFMFSHPYATYDPAADVPRVIFLARQSKYDGRLVPSPALDASRVPATRASKMMFRADPATGTFTVVQRNRDYSAVNEFKKRYIPSRTVNRTTGRPVALTNPFRDFGYRYLTRFNEADTAAADRFFEMVPRYRGRIFDEFFAPLEQKIDDIDSTLKDWLNMYRDPRVTDFIPLPPALEKFFRKATKGVFADWDRDKPLIDLVFANRPDIDTLLESTRFTQLLRELPYDVLKRIVGEFDHKFLPTLEQRLAEQA